MSSKSTLRNRFIFALALYSVLALALWFGYYLINYNTVSRIAKENTILAAQNIIEQVSVEFEQMKSSASIIAGSAFVQDFLEERNKYLLYEKAVTVSEIISKMAFPMSSSDSVITISANGDYYRFAGGLNNQSCEILYEIFKDAGTVYTIMELNGGLYLCHNAPVFDVSKREPRRIGSVLVLTGLSKTRRNVENLSSIKDIDTALILDGEIILSNNPTLEHRRASELEDLYAVVSTVGISGTPLSVAAAIPNSALFPESTMFLITSFAFLGLLFVIVAVLYNYLSRFIIRPMTDIIENTKEVGRGTKDRLPRTGKQDFDVLVSDINEMLDKTERFNTAKQKMQMGLLSSQMDAHFVFNTLTNIKNLSKRGDNEKAAQMADGLSVLLRHQHKGDKMANVLDEFGILEKYFTVMNIRFDGKYIYDFDIDENLSDCLMPGFILQPIVENALTHGLEDKDTDARLLIKGSIQEEKIYIEVTDNGAGIPPGKLKEIQDSLAHREIDDFPEPGLHGVALQNIQRRIRLQFGNEYGIMIDSEYGKGTTVKLLLPLLSNANGKEV